MNTTSEVTQGETFRIEDRDLELRIGQLVFVRGLVERRGGAAWGHVVGKRRDEPSGRLHVYLIKLEGDGRDVAAVPEDVAISRHARWGEHR